MKYQRSAVLHVSAAWHWLLTFLSKSSALTWHWIQLHLSRKNSISAFQILCHNFRVSPVLFPGIESWNCRVIPKIVLILESGPMDQYHVYPCLIYLRRHIYGERNSGIFGKNPHIFVPPKFWPPLQNPPNKFFCNLLE